MHKVVAFDGWLEQFTAAAPEDRAAMEQEGTALAQARRPEFKKLIVTNPQRALAMTVPRVVRQDLPEAVVTQLEQPVSARGDFKAYFGRPLDAAALPPDQELVLRYFETPAGASYKARVFGSLLEQTTRKDVALRGVAIDRELAVAENPVREPEPPWRKPAPFPISRLPPAPKPS
jgi:hypothetical protein